MTGPAAEALPDPLDRKGLSGPEAAFRLAREGPNELANVEARGFLRIVREILTEPLILLLVAGGLLYLLLGEARDAFLLIGSVFVIIGIEVYQDYQTERAVQALRDLADPHVEVIRDGRLITVPARDVVRGDLVRLEEGGRVPADGWVLEPTHLEVDESILTGESVPVRKSAWDGATGWGRPGGDDRPLAFAQTLAVRGRGLLRVRATGMRTEASRIAGSLTEVEREVPLLRRQTRRLVRTMAVLAVGLCVLIAVVEGWRSSDWSTGLLAGIALALALVPEEMPVVLTIYTTLGARRMSRERVLTRRFGAIATLGSTTVLCVDKTGTLTENRMRVAAVARPGWEATFPFGALDDGARAAVRVGALASPPASRDPTDVAFRDAALEAAAGIAPLPGPDRLLGEVAEARRWLSVALAWSEPRGERWLALKGSPEKVFQLCGLPLEDRSQWNAVLSRLARRGLRVLAVARAAAPTAADGVRIAPGGFEILGLVGLEDPVRPGVPAAIQECRGAGVRVVMITGDHAATASAIAEAAGFPRPHAVLTGPDLERLDDERLREAVEGTDVFARIVPEEKLRIVRALKARGEVVGMTGDGVNDAPALKSAHVGVAMGRRGTDVAREAAGLILLDDDFPAMAGAVREGRRIYANMQKAFAYLVAIHVAIAGVALIPVLFDLPLVLFPVQIVFLELFIDPTCSIAFEGDPEDPLSMRRPPRDPSEPLLPRSLLIRCFVSGALVAAAATGLYAGALALGVESNVARALAFVTLVAGNATLMFAVRATSAAFRESLRARNLSMVVLLAATVVGLATLLYVPAVAQTFLFAPPPVELTALAAAVGAGAALWFEGARRLVPLPGPAPKSPPPLREPT